MSQSPSLRGSGRFRTGDDGSPVARRASQSPSLRGSGRFKKTENKDKKTEKCLNPLHCGAVVASWVMRHVASLLVHGLNPLHCGAVVASGTGRWPCSSPISLNPLHCGAVVASSFAEPYQEALLKSQSPSLRGSGRFRRSSWRAWRASTCVSIPFIAGQWSLPEARAAQEAAARVSQSPSLRGSGRFKAGADLSEARTEVVSIPFIAGQWSLLPPPSLPLLWRWSLNPLHCGAVVASLGGSTSAPPRRASQSPSLRGSGRFAESAADVDILLASVSIPFIAGQWSLRSAHRRRRDNRFARLNPLHCGAVVASDRPALGPR